jgi:NADH-quinone oxidoreductase subunit E
MDIPAELERKVDEAVSHYPVSKRSAALPLLHLVQEHYGFVSKEAADWVAARLGLEPINILELVTFYPMFRAKPPGKHHIRVCRTLSCAMAGGYRLMADFCEFAKIERGSHHGHGDPVTVGPDGEFSIEFVECLASCGTGPVCMVDDDFYENVSREGAASLVEKYQAVAATNIS